VFLNEIKHRQVALGVANDTRVVFQLQQTNVTVVILQSLELKLGAFLRLKRKPFVTSFVGCHMFIQPRLVKFQQGGIAERSLAVGTAFGIHLKKRRRELKQFDLDALAEASAGFSGAEIEQAVVSAMHDAFAAKGELATEHVLAALKASPPLSVTMAEKIGELRAWAKGRCAVAD
jgi:hypothetical protein